LDLFSCPKPLHIHIRISHLRRYTYLVNAQPTLRRLRHCNVFLILVKLLQIPHSSIRPSPVQTLWARSIWQSFLQGSPVLFLSAHTLMFPRLQSCPYGLIGRNDLNLSAYSGTKLFFSVRCQTHLGTIM